jgi:hypothetical protein
LIGCFRAEDSTSMSANNKVPVGSQERFAQTGVGWVLREHSRSD